VGALAARGTLSAVIAPRQYVTVTLAAGQLAASRSAAIAVNFSGGSALATPVNDGLSGTIEGGRTFEDGLTAIISGGVYDGLSATVVGGAHRRVPST
jgi:hypothetical protein